METTDKLDMSLDEIIQNRKRVGVRGRRRGGIQKPVAPARLSRRGGRDRARPLGAGQAFREPQLDERGKWKKDTSATPRRGTRIPRFPTRPRQGVRPVTIPQRPQEYTQQIRPPTTDKLFLSNLEYRVTERDLLELFSQIGPLLSVRVNYDRSGRSLGTGEVTFKLPHHATMADRRFNGILIDGKPLVIQQSGAYPSGQNPGPTKLSSGITVMDPNESMPQPMGSQYDGKKPGEDMKSMHSLKSAVMATIAPDHPSLHGDTRLRSSIMRSGMYSDRMDIG